MTERAEIRERLLRMREDYPIDLRYATSELDRNTAPRRGPSITDSGKAPTLGGDNGSVTTRAHCAACGHQEILELRAHLVCGKCGAKGATLAASSRCVDGIDPR